MRFLLTGEHRAFAAALDDLLSAVDTGAVARSWAAGAHEPGLELWRRLVQMGVPDLLTEGSAVDLVVALERLGYHAVPGPWIETAAVLPGLDSPSPAPASVVLLPHTPYALDADVAAVRLLADGAELWSFEPGKRLRSVDPARRLFEPVKRERLGEASPAALDHGALGAAAVLLGAGQWLLDSTVDYAGQRAQYGRVIGGYQAVKHLLAEVAVALELARPLVHAAAVTLDPRDVSAAKVATGEAATLAARTGLQVHGAIGYTAEHDLGLRLTKVRALVSGWGTPRFHRGRVLAG